MAKYTDNGHAQVLSAGQNPVHCSILPRQADFFAHLIWLTDNIKGMSLIIGIRNVLDGIFDTSPAIPMIM